MRTVNDWSVGPRSPSSERRGRRTTLLADALRFQLDACREDEGLAAIVVSDALGFCVAHSGGDGDHDDLAARLPMMADPAQRLRDAASDEPLLRSTEAVVVTTFTVPGATLHLGTIRGPQGRAASPATLDRVASGFSRLLAQ